MSSIELPCQMLAIFYKYNGAIYFVTANERQNKEYMLEKGCYACKYILLTVEKIKEMYKLSVCV